ncbi:MAG: DUF4260 domain-containing protein [Staphylococcus epidermidis]|nr:DUF4260 domain-containing protein [Staphylococcus epidermidis]
MRSVIKLENAFIFIITIAVYFKLEFSIWLFLLLLLVPDIFMLGYVINRKTGSYVYNIGHTCIIPIIIALLYLYIDERLLLQISLIWLAHISMDRTMGFRLKYSSDTDKTTIQKI